MSTIPVSPTTPADAATRRVVRHEQRHLAVRQEVNLAVMAIVEEMGMSVAFPTRTVHLVEAGARA